MESSTRRMMRLPQKSLFETTILFTILVLGLFQRLQFLGADLEKIIQFVPDDAFYYLKTAKYFSSTYKFTFDGIYQSNGFHPLWMALLLPLAITFSEPLTLLRAALLLAIILNTLGAIILYQLLKRLTKKWWISTIGVAIYFLGYYATRSSINGLETSLSTFLFILAFHACIGGLGFDNSTRSAFILGIILGMLFLARTDNVFFIAAFITANLFKTIQWNRSKYALTLLGSVCLTSAPWLIWTWISSGSPIQSSGLAVPYVIRTNYILEGHSNTDALVFGMQQMRDFILFRRDLLGFSIVSLFLLVFSGFTYLSSPDLEHFDGVRTTVLLWFAAAVLVFSHTFIRWYPREWYFDPLVVLEVVTLSLFLSLPIMSNTFTKGIDFAASFVSKKNLRIAAIFAVVLAIIMLMRSQQRFVNSAPYPWQLEMLEAAYWLEENTPVNTKATAFNAGIMGYFSGRVVINLDGAINSDAYSAITQEQLMCLIKESSADYYLDYDPVMLAQYRYYLGEIDCPMKMSKIGEVDLPDLSWADSNISIYSLVP